MCESGNKPEKESTMGDSRAGSDARKQRFGAICFMPSSRISCREKEWLKTESGSIQPLENQSKKYMIVFKYVYMDEKDNNIISADKAQRW